MSPISRREFLKLSAGAALGALLAESLPLQLLRAQDGGNPLGSYPDRGWESIYRDQYRYDSSFTYVCSPNDTHACRLRAFVRNGIILRSETNYDVEPLRRPVRQHGHRRTGTRAAARKGQTLHRRVYGPHRLKGPLMRKGWKAWADDGFPELDAANRSKYKFDSRGTDELLPVSLGDGQRLHRTRHDRHRPTLLRRGGSRAAAGRKAIPPEMIEAMGGAGTRTFKCRGGMGLLGVIGKYGMYRFANTLALLDTHVRGVDRTEARGGRTWSNYTWHGDQAPGHPFVHRSAGLGRGLQRPAQLAPAHPVRQEPGREQDARVALLHRGDGARREDRHHHAGILAARDQIRLLDSRSARRRTRRCSWASRAG